MSFPSQNFFGSIPSALLPACLDTVDIPNIAAHADIFGPFSLKASALPSPKPLSAQDAHVLP